MKSKSKNIPIFIIEEHHEAFIVWNYAIQQGLIPTTNNCLFHVDEHSDMRVPRFNESIHNLNSDLEKIKRFTYQELNIASFIIPACYNGIFNQIYWIRQKHRKTLQKSVEMFVRSYNQMGKKLISGKTKNLNKEIIDMKLFKYLLRTIDQLPSNKKVVLDIDLDYFSCSGNPNELKEMYIEITKEQYEQFVCNPYHRLNFSELGRIEALEKGNKYYYVMNNYNEIYPCELKVDEATIKGRISLFVELLKHKNITPIIIDICRSRYSGYTPSEQWEYIEHNLLLELNKAYATIELKVT